MHHIDLSILRFSSYTLLYQIACMYVETHSLETKIAKSLHI